jgi:hypothetical protein
MSAPEQTTATEYRPIEVISRRAGLTLRAPRGYVIETDQQVVNFDCGIETPGRVFSSDGDANLFDNYLDKCPAPTPSLRSQTG